jgi:hypothetical protein
VVSGQLNLQVIFWENHLSDGSFTGFLGLIVLTPQVATGAFRGRQVRNQV